MPIPSEVQQADPEKRLVYLAERIDQLANELRLDSVVVLGSAGGEDGRTITFRWPDCAPECPSPDACAVHVYRDAADALLGMAGKISDGAEVEKNTAKPVVVP